MEFCIVKYCEYTFSMRTVLEIINLPFETCLVIARHVLRSQYISCDHKTCPTIWNIGVMMDQVRRSHISGTSHRVKRTSVARVIIFVLRKSIQKVTTCPVITKYVSWSQDMSRDHNTCLLITTHVSWPQDMSRKHVSWSQDISGGAFEIAFVWD